MSLSLRQCLSALVFRVWSQVCNATTYLRHSAFKVAFEFLYRRLKGYAWGFVLTLNMSLYMSFAVGGYC
jgi:hypothetical protein